MNIPLLHHGLAAWRAVTAALDGARPLAALVARAYLAQVFFLSGLTKIRDWDTTLLLFTEEYRVPLLPPDLAAVLGTAGELVLPVLLLVGLAGRFAALGLSVVNVVAVLSLAEISPPPCSSTSPGACCWPRWRSTAWAGGRWTAPGASRVWRADRPRTAPAVGP